MLIPTVLTIFERMSVTVEAKASLLEWFNEYTRASRWPCAWS